MFTGPSEPEAEAVFQAAFIPIQQSVAVTSLDMVAFIATYPPLGQVSQLINADVTFTAVLEISPELVAEPWELALWHPKNDESNDGEWVEAMFVPSGPDQRPSTVHNPGNALTRLYFTANLNVKISLNFTVKFRRTPNHSWRWIRDEQGLGDGIVIINQAAVQDSHTKDLPDLIQGLNPDLKWKSHMSQCPGTRLWSVQAPIAGAKDDNSAVADIPLGVPWGTFLRWFALVRIWTPWLTPRHGGSQLNLDKDAVLCSFLSPQGKHLVILGISGLNDVMTLFRSSESGELLIHIRNDGTEASTGTVLVAVGDNFESANASVMYQARSLVIGSQSTDLYDAEVAALQKKDGVEPLWYEDWYDGLGYCTWNALGQRLTDQKVLKAVDTLAANGIDISSLIIDDNWQDIDYRGNGQWQQGWNDFEAEPKTFPKGLKALVSEIRSKHRNIQHIAVWHALLGYWAGVSPDGQIAKRYKTIEVTRTDSDPRNLPLDGKMTLVAKEDARRFYDDFYRFLTSCGIDGVKTDGQYMVDNLVSAKARRELIQTYQDAWTLASLRHFSNKVISCMSQNPQMLFYSQLPHNRPAVVCRNSDDFIPEVLSSHPWHVWANAHNTLLTQHLNILPDWDMFQTVHEYSGFHAAARCVSGGPVYITDVPGQHDVGLIRQMTGVTTRGKTVVFRPSVLGRTIDQYTGYYDAQLLKIGAYHGRAATGTPIIGLFNVLARPLTEIVPLARFSGVLGSMKYVVRSHSTGKVTLPLQIGPQASLLTVSLGVGGYDILCAFPLVEFESKAYGQVFVTNLGLVGKMTGCAAILNSKYGVLENGRLIVDVTLKALGVLGVYISALPDLSVKEDFMATIQGQPLPPHTVSVDEADGNVLKVDVETAWNEMRLESGWSNEVEVKIYFLLEK